MRTRIVGLLDCDSFYASCEKVFRPDWARRPLVVLSNNDGCVVARSAEAKALQIPMGEPYFRLKSFAEARGVIVRSANYSLYGDMSRRVMQTLERWTADVDVYSIDESFLDLTGRFPAAEGELPPSTRAELDALAEEITTTVRRWTGIPVSLGLAPNRTLAKAASRLAKDEYAASGRKYASIFSESERVAALRRLPVEKVWGVGRKLRESFMKSGLRTAYDLSRCDPKFIRQSYTIEQERMVRELRGEFVYDAQPPAPRQSMQVSRSFGETISSIEELEKPISTFAAKIAAKLRAHSLVASGIYVHMATSPFAKTKPYRHVGGALNFSKPTNLSPEILSTALRLMRSLFEEECEYKRAGVVALDLVEEQVANERRYLFEPDPTMTPERRGRDQRLSRALDALNARFGRNAVFFASEGVERAWSPNSSFISPNYTTDWNALPTAW